MRFPHRNVGRSLAAFAVGLCLLAHGVPACAANADVNHGSVTFLAHQADVPLEGRFARFAGKVEFDPDHPQGASVHVAIDVQSADAGSADANALLLGHEFFDAQRYPEATFSATAITPLGPGRYLAKGALLLKGHSGDVSVPFAARRDATGLWLEGSAKISRLAYKVGEGQWSDTSTLDDEVQIQFKLQVAP